VIPLKKTNKNSNKSSLLILIFIIFLVIVSIIFIYYQSLDNVLESNSEFVKEFDDRISPFTPQGLFFEINRIRKKGIIDVMMDSGLDIFQDSPTTGNEFQIVMEGLRPGFGWDKKPVFSYIAVIDGFEWRGKLDFETWDTDYINWIIKKSVEEEQEKGEIEFSFIEKNRIGFKSHSQVIENFNIVYDFKTGRWTGDDYFNDTDGYGHYNGSYFEMWFSVCQTDYDGDNIPYWSEVNLQNTNPKVDDSKLDPDMDGIPTSWEWKWGYNPFQWENHSQLDPDQDGLQNDEEYYMEKWLANPFIPEIYIEVDYMEKAPFKLFDVVIEKGKILPISIPRIKRSRLDGWDHIFWEESQQMIIELFNEHGIVVHIDDGVMGGGGDILPFSLGAGAHMFTEGLVADFYKNNFADERKGIYRYLCILHGGGWCAPQDERNYMDCMTVPSNQQFFNKQLDMAITPRTKRIGRAVQVLHELGHSFGFLKSHCGGVDNTSRKAKNPSEYPWLDYVSVMNYDYFRQRFFDYSNGNNGEYDADDWGLIDLTFFQEPYNEIIGIDWNRDDYLN
jgi:hypothetical protein